MSARATPAPPAMMRGAAALRAGRRAAASRRAAAAGRGLARVAVLEPDKKSAAALERLLEDRGYEAALYPTPGRFFDALLEGRPEAVLLEMRPPGIDGGDIIRVLRSNPQTRGVLIIAMAEGPRSGADVVDGLSAGADEYLVKPIDLELLLARLESLLSRRAQRAGGETRLGVEGLDVSTASRLCRLKGREIRLARLEFDLLVYFLKQTNRVLTREHLLEAVWQSDLGVATRTVDKHVETLRRKLGSFGRRLETVFRVGYRFRAA